MQKESSLKGSMFPRGTVGIYLIDFLIGYSTSQSSSYPFTHTSLGALHSRSNPNFHGQCQESNLAPLG